MLFKQYLINCGINKNALSFVFISLQLPVMCSECPDPAFQSQVPELAVIRKYRNVL